MHVFGESATQVSPGTQQLEKTYKHNNICVNRKKIIPPQQRVVYMYNSPTSCTMCNPILETSPKGEFWQTFSEKQA